MALRFWLTCIHIQHTHQLQSFRWLSMGGAEEWSLYSPLWEACNVCVCAALVVRLMTRNVRMTRIPPERLLYIHNTMQHKETLHLLFLLITACVYQLFAEQLSSKKKKREREREMAWNKGPKNTVVWAPVEANTLEKCVFYVKRPHLLTFQICQNIENHSRFACLSLERQTGKVVKNFKYKSILKLVTNAKGS